MARLFPIIMHERQNTHNATHKARSAMQYGTTRCSDCRRLETNHACARCVVTNHQAVEVKMMKHNLVLMTLHAMKHGDSSEEMGFGKELLKFIEEDKCFAALLSSRQEADTYAEGNINVDDEVPSESLRVASRGVSVQTLSASDLRDLQREYKSRYPTMVMPKTLAGTGTVKEYPWIDVAGKPKFQRRVQVGGDYEIWTLRDDETAMEIEEHPYVARVHRILGHRPSVDHDEVFWVELRWYKRLEVRDNTVRRDTGTGCPIYRRQNGDLSCSRWNTMHTPTDILRPVHMLHRCTAACAAEDAQDRRPMLGAKPTNRERTHSILATKEFVLNMYFVG